MEDKEGCADQAHRSGAVIPAQMRAEVEGGKDAEDNQCDDFLNDLELDGREAGGADAVGGHLQQVLEKGDAPAD